MSKSKNGHSKRGLPKDLQRITNASGVRVWITGGKEYKTLAELRDDLKQ